MSYPAICLHFLWDSSALSCAQSQPQVCERLFRGDLSCSIKILQFPISKSLNGKYLWASWAAVSAWKYEKMLSHHHWASVWSLYPTCKRPSLYRMAFELSLPQLTGAAVTPDNWRCWHCFVSRLEAFHTELLSYFLCESFFLANLCCTPCKTSGRICRLPVSLYD